MVNFLQTLGLQFLSTLPLFMLILLGYLLIKCLKWSKEITEALSKFTFSVAIPIMLFHIMSHFSEVPVADYTLLFAFFGGTFIVFFIGRVIAATFFKLNGTQGILFAMGGIYSNNVFVGLPIVKALLGDEAVPSVALVVVFSSMILWTLASISVELSEMGRFSVKSFQKTTKNILKNPIIFGIVLGLIVNYMPFSLPSFIDKSTLMVSNMGAPLSLIVLGMGLAEYQIRSEWRSTLVICLIKLALLPFVVYLLARCLGLNQLDTQVVVLLGSMSIAINCYIMARQFRQMESVIASSLLVSTILSAITTPLILSILVNLYS